MSEQPKQPAEHSEAELEQSQPAAESASQQAEATVQSETETPDAASQQRIAELEAQLSQAQQMVEEQKDSVIRAKAEMENIRRRATQDVEKAHKFALEKFAQELLPVVDNLERALQAGDATDEALKPVLEGVELTLKSFSDVLLKFGLEALAPIDEPFNPEHHQAMAMQPSDAHKPNTVLSVMQKGYLLNGRLLRPAMVIVSKAAD